MGPKFSVLCHTATEPLVSHHGLRKYWHFVFFMKEVLPYTYKQKGWGGGKKDCGGPGVQKVNMRGLVPCRDGASRGRGGQERRSESLWFSDSLQKVLEGP